MAKSYRNSEGNARPGGRAADRARSASAPPRPAQQTAPRSASPAAGTPGERTLTIETGGGL